MRRSLVSGLIGSVGTTNEFTRHQWVKETLAKIPPGSRLLDAGAGEQQYRSFCSHVEYVAQDFAAFDPGAETTGLQPESWDDSGLDIVSDIIDIPEPDASFDAVLCTEVLEHLPYPVLALEEFARLLRPGGILIVTAPFCSMTHFAPYHFHTGFSRYFYERVLPEIGFDVLEVTPNGNYFEYVAQELRRLPSVSKRYARVKGSLSLRIPTVLLLRLLGRLSRIDGGSSELLAYGFHVRARRH